jgi:hypothetical protein
LIDEKQILYEDYAMGFCGWACGIINDHDETCPCYERINAANQTVNKRKDMEVY